MLKPKKDVHELEIKFKKGKFLKICELRDEESIQTLGLFILNNCLLDIVLIL